MTVYFFQIVSLLIALVLVNGMNALGSTDDDVDLQQNPADLDLAGSFNRPSQSYGGGYGGYGHGYGGGYGGFGGVYGGRPAISPFNGNTKPNPNKFA